MDKVLGCLLLVKASCGRFHEARNRIIEMDAIKNSRGGIEQSRKRIASGSNNYFLTISSDELTPNGLLIWQYLELIM